MIETDIVYNEDCRIGLDRIPDGSVDLVIMDPPYKLGRHGGGSFGPANRTYRNEIAPLSDGIDDELLEKIVSKLREVNIYIWCNKAQILQYLSWFDARGCNTDILTWHKTNPVPACNNKFLSDTEYIVYARDPGVKLYGSYETKRKWYVSPYNKADKDRWHHPTIKPLDITVNMVLNSTGGGLRGPGPVHGLRNHGDSVHEDRTQVRRVRDRPRVLGDLYREDRDRGQSLMK